MSRGRCKFTQADVTKAVRAVIAAGVDVREVMVDANGAIRVIVGKVETPPLGDDLDRELAEFVRLRG
jgi:hypothetical protein